MGESLLKKVRKEGQNQRIKCEEIKEEEDDRISALPDCLLLEILSRLPYTQYAIRTGTLSKRWQHIWPSVPTLILRTYSLRNSNSESDFILLLDKTLTQSRQLKLKIFDVYMFYDIQFESKFRNWIRFALKCNVEKLDLNFWGRDGDREAKFVLDESIFINSCLTDLRLEQCKLSPPGAISWENLRSLGLFRVNLHEDLIVNILTGSPLMETLAVQYCEELHDADIIGINAPTSSLSLTQCRQLKHLKKFELHADYDSPFILQLNNWIRYAIRCNVKELTLDFVNVESNYDFILDQILFTSSCFTELSLEGCMLNPVGAISWKNLRSLCIFYYRSLDEDLIEKLLSGSPVLETLDLCYSSGYTRLNITSKSVKNLLFSGYMVPDSGPEPDVIEINAPNILSLKIKGNVLCTLSLLNVSSLVEAKLNYDRPMHKDPTTTPIEGEQEILKGYLMNLCHVKELQLGSYCSEVFSCLQAKGFVFPSNVKLTLVKDN